jgi:hypothetical protein
MRRGIVLVVALLSCAAAASVASAAELVANTTSNNGGATGWAIFFDVNSSGAPLTITDMTTASTATAGAPFTVEVFTRSGSGLGGPVTAGPGSSPAGWTSLGTAVATQGATSSGISQPINIPDITVGSGVTGVAVLFTGAGPRYFGTASSGPYQTFNDGNLNLVTGDSRSAPFTPTGSWFAPRGLTGSLIYTAVPEPASLTMLTAMAAGIVVRRRR